MILHLVENGNTPAYTTTVPALFALQGHQRVYAAGLPVNGDLTVNEGDVAHARTSAGQAICVVGLFTCSAVFYCYQHGGQTTDVVAFHAPSGLLDFKRSARTGKFGDPASEAAHYGIAGYDDVRLIIATGPDTCNYGEGTREERVNRALRDDIGQLLNHFGPSASFIYDNATFQRFGVNGLGHVGEPGGNGIRTTPPPAEEPESTAKCRCYLSTAIMLALGKPDDCAELMALRRFRDTYMAYTPQRREEVAHYYRTAPAIVANIALHRDSARVYEDIYRRYLARALSALRAGQLPLAHHIYRTMALELATLFGPG